MRPASKPNAHVMQMSEPLPRALEILLGDRDRARRATWATWATWASERAVLGLRSILDDLRDGAVQGAVRMSGARALVGEHPSPDAWLIRAPELRESPVRLEVEADRAAQAHVREQIEPRESVDLCRFAWVSEP